MAQSATHLRLETENYFGDGLISKNLFAAKVIRPDTI
jgi:hypothetical protein